jgi:hypothetical protein
VRTEQGHCAIMDARRIGGFPSFGAALTATATMAARGPEGRSVQALFRRTGRWREWRWYIEKSTIILTATAMGRRCGWRQACQLMPHHDLIRSMPRICVFNPASHARWARCFSALHLISSPACIYGTQPLFLCTTYVTVLRDPHQLAIMCLGIFVPFNGEGS